ncbi:hypothetical protein FMM79_20280 [Novosphingobium sp. BW1]|nr:hypothetical protein FMM79_20280 [Novosphingobium sp. BW1]
MQPPPPVHAPGAEAMPRIAPLPGGNPLPSIGDPLPPTAPQDLGTNPDTAPQDVAEEASSGVPDLPAPLTPPWLALLVDLPVPPVAASPAPPTPAGFSVPHQAASPSAASAQDSVLPLPAASVPSASSAPTPPQASREVPSESALSGTITHLRMSAVPVQPPVMHSFDAAARPLQIPPENTYPVRPIALAPQGAKTPESRAPGLEDLAREIPATERLALSPATLLQRPSLHRAAPTQPGLPAPTSAHAQYGPQLAPAPTPPAPPPAKGIATTSAKVRTDLPVQDGELVPQPPMAFASRSTIKEEGLPLSARAPEKVADTAMPSGASQVPAPGRAPSQPSPLLPPIIVQGADTPALPGSEIQAPLRAETPHDFDTLLGRLHEAREAQGGQVVRTSLVHAQFGHVSLQLRPDETGMSVSLRSADPDFAASVQGAAAQVLAASGTQGSDTPRENPFQQSSGQQGQNTAPSPNGQDHKGAQSFAQGAGQAREDGQPSGSSGTPRSGGREGSDTPVRGSPSRSSDRPARDTRGGIYA